MRGVLPVSLYVNSGRNVKSRGKNKQVVLRKLRNKKFQMPAALTAVSEKREAREIPGFSFYDLNPAEAPPLGRKKKSMRGAGRLPVLVGRCSRLECILP